jgi:hypothetical protein
MEELLAFRYSRKTCIPTRGDYEKLHHPFYHTDCAKKTPEGKALTCLLNLISKDLCVYKNVTTNLELACSAILSR